MKGEWLLVAACLVAFVPSVRADGSEETAVQEFAKMPPKLTLESSAADVLRACREMLPTRPVELKGALILRNRRGIVSREYDYALVMRRAPDVTLMTVRLTPRGETNLLATVSVSRRGARPPTIQLAKANAPGEATVPSLLERVMETDVTWLDVGIDFVNWRNPALAGEDRLKGRVCDLLDVEPAAPLPGCAKARLWVDRAQKVVMQAAQLDETGRETRKLWVRAVQKVDERWIFKDLEVETTGTAHRTRLHFDKVSFPDQR